MTKQEDELLSQARTFATDVVAPAAAGWDRDRIVDAISEEGIPVGSGACAEIYREKAFSGHGLAPVHPLPIAKSLGETSVMVNVDHLLDESHMEAIASTIESVLTRASR